MKFQIEQVPGGDGFQFRLLSNAGDVWLTSSTFADRDGCTAAIRTAIERIADEGNFENRAEDGQFFAVLSDENGARLAISEGLASAAAAASRIGVIATEAEEQEDYEVTLTTTTLTSAALPSFLGSAFTNFEELYDFTLSSASNQPGFELFQSDKDQEFYFFFNDAAGKSILYSRGFKDASRRKKRIGQVIKNAQREDKYDRRDSGGQYSFILNGSNGQEIARSPMFASEAEREAAIAYLMGNAGEYASLYIKPKRKSQKKAVNQYNLDRKSTSGNEGFEDFRNADDKQHYFHLNDQKAAALLFSQGYASAKSRDNGIRSVIKNGGDRTRYELREEGGKHYFILRAGNRQEIARSRNFATVAEAESFIDYLVGKLPGYAAIYGVAAAEIATTQTESFTLTVDRDEPEVEAPASKKVIDDYLPCDEYAGERGFHKFYREDRKEYYFSYINDDDEVVLRSEGYTTAAARDNGIESVKKNAPIEKRWLKETAMDGKYHYFALRAGNNQEIARSCYYESKGAMLAAFGWLSGALGLLGAAAAVAAAPAPTPAPTAVAAATPAPSQPVAKIAKSVPVAAPVAAPVPPPAAAKSGGIPWGCLIPLLLVLLLAALFFLFRGCESEKPVATPPPATKVAPPAEQPAAQERTAPAAETPEPAKPALLGPTAASLGFAADSPEGMLANYLSDPASTFPKTFRLANLNFETDLDQLEPAAKAILDKVTKVLEAYPSVKFRIDGHTDNRATEAYNLDLSDRRAKMVGNYFRGKGINSSRFTTRGFGESQPIASNETQGGQYQNRRVELVVTER